jgi:hypothetical protein
VAVVELIAPWFSSVVTSPLSFPTAWLNVPEPGGAFSTVLIAPFRAPAAVEFVTWVFTISDICDSACCALVGTACAGVVLPADGVPPLGAVLGTPPLGDALGAVLGPVAPGVLPGTTAPELLAAPLGDADGLPLLDADDPPVTDSEPDAPGSTAPALLALETPPGEVAEPWAPVGPPPIGTTAVLVLHDFEPWIE